MNTFSTANQFGSSTPRDEVGGNIPQDPHLILVNVTADEGVRNMEAVVVRNSLLVRAPVESFVEKPVEQPVANPNLDIEEARRQALEAA